MSHCATSTCFFLMLTVRAFSEARCVGPVWTRACRVVDHYCNTHQHTIRCCSPTLREIQYYKEETNVGVRRHVHPSLRALTLASTCSSFTCMRGRFKKLQIERPRTINLLHVLTHHTKLRFMYTTAHVEFYRSPVYHSV